MKKKKLTIEFIFPLFLWKKPSADKGKSVLTGVNIGITCVNESYLNGLWFFTLRFFGFGFRLSGGERTSPKRDDNRDK